MHPTATDGFVRPDIYERGRPGYPDELVTAMALDATTTVVDLGCGTGKFTRQLATTQAAVIGIEPLAGMLVAFHEALPDVAVAAGLAEALPLRDSSCDVITCASAFHWFDHERAIPEIHRCLRPDGRLAIVWNRRDSLDGWAKEFWAITEAHRGDTPGYRSGAWRDALERSSLFGPITETWFDFVQHTDVEGLLARVASISFIETMPDDERTAVIDEARRFIGTHPETAGRTTFELPYRSVLYVSRPG